MLSGRYVTDHRARHWSKTNPQGFCNLCFAARKNDDRSNPSSMPLGSLEHLLLDCPELSNTRYDAKLLWFKYTEDKPKIRTLLIDTINSSLNNWLPDMQVLIDPTVCPYIVRAAQYEGARIYSHVLYLSRTWCSMLHNRRIKLLKLLNIV